MTVLMAVMAHHPGVAIHSNLVQPGGIFFALRGETADGHDYVSDALNHGAAYAVIDDPAYQHDDRCLLVDNAEAALQDLARLYRQTLTETTVVVVAGSNGKTTTKNLLAAVLGAHYPTHATTGNLNNHIGVPLSILAIPKSCRYAVIELGANHPGEHAVLCDIAQPDYGLITNCGKDHLEGYGSIAGVIAANCEVYDYLRIHSGTAIVNGDDAILMEQLNGLPHIGYAQTNQTPHGRVVARVTATYPRVSVSIVDTHTHEHVTIRSALLGQFQADNIAAAACVGVHAGVPLPKIQAAIEAYVPDNNRSQVIEWGSNSVILDAYNANPSSMAAMLQYFSAYPATAKWVILGDMFELGAVSESEHLAIVTQLKTQAFDQIILVGHGFKSVKAGLDCLHFDDADALSVFLNQHPIHDACILVKGSRGMRLETAFT